jgi:hypothetical protein
VRGAAGSDSSARRTHQATKARQSLS